jgi:hypothetical protein
VLVVRCGRGVKEGKEKDVQDDEPGEEAPVFAAAVGFVVIVIVIVEGFAGVFCAPVEAEDLGIVFFFVAEEAEAVGFVFVVVFVVVVGIVVGGFGFPIVIFSLFCGALLLVAGSFRVALEIDDGHLGLL